MLSSAEHGRAGRRLAEPDAIDRGVAGRRQAMYALEGSVFIGGADVPVAARRARSHSPVVRCRALASSVTDNGGVYLVPPLPGWRAALGSVRAGTIVASRGHHRRAYRARGRRKHCVQVADLLEALVVPMAGIALAELRVDGRRGRQRRTSAVSGRPARRACRAPRSPRPQRWAPAYWRAWLSVFWDSNEALAQHWRADKRFQPSMPPAQAAARRAEWREALNRSKGWITPGR